MQLLIKHKKSLLIGNILTEFVNWISLAYTVSLPLNDNLNSPSTTHVEEKIIDKSSLFNILLNFEDNLNTILSSRLIKVNKIQLLVTLKDN